MSLIFKYMSGPRVVGHLQLATRRDKSPGGSVFLMQPSRVFDHCGSQYVVGKKFTFCKNFQHASA
jgi:hypothetical protein